MNESMNQNQVENGSSSTAARETYVKPTIEIIEMEMEGAILQGSGSDYDDGGRYGR